MTLPPCARCGTLHGRVKAGKLTPGRHSAVKYGVNGRVCLNCWGVLYRAGKASHAAPLVLPRCKTPYCPNRWGGRNGYGLCTDCCERRRLKYRDRSAGRHDYGPSNVSEAEAAERTAAVREMGAILLLDKRYQPLVRPPTPAQIAVAEYRRAEQSMARIRSMAV